MLSPGLPRAPQRLIFLIAAITVVPLVTLLWLGWRLLDQDRALERQQIQQRVERGADLLVTTLQRAIAASEQQLAAGMEQWPEGAVALAPRDGGIEVHPRDRVAYLPVTPPLPEAAATAFAAGEALEFRDRNLSAATAAFADLAKSPDPALRAGALLRLSRTLRKAGRFDEALASYRRLMDMDAVGIGGVPASLAAAYARCRLFADEQRVPELRAEALELDRQLRAGRWSLPAAVYTLYAADAARWSGQDAPPPRREEVFAEAVEALWTGRLAAQADRRAGSGRELLDVRGETFAVLWQSSDAGVRALVAARSFVESQWLAGLEPVAADQRVSFALRADGKDLFGAINSSALAGVSRQAADTALPWTIVSSTIDPPPEDRAFALRRRWLIAGLVVLVSMALVASYLIVRAVGHELALARQQSDFVAAVSHEFRTPLTTLRQFTDMLREQSTLGDDRRRQAYEAQSRATDRLTRLVESLLDFGRMEAGAWRYRFESHDCADLVRHVVEDFRAEPTAAGRDIEFVARDSARVDVDAEAMARAVRNLLDNAVKYSPDPSQVEVALARQNGHVLISVRDRGMGIPDHERKQIFAKFHRGEQARTQGIKGTGIGLAMVHEIVRAHRGRVDVDSEPGIGTTFTIVLPLS